MRVITGTARGRKLQEPSGMDIRPTADVVKEAVFNIIQFDIEGRRVLDLFAGTGQLGIPGGSLALGQEAVSRTGNGAGQASILAGLKHDHADYSQCTDDLDHSNNSFNHNDPPFCRFTAYGSRNSSQRAIRTIYNTTPQTVLQGKFLTVQHHRAKQLRRQFAGQKQRLGGLIYGL